MLRLKLPLAALTLALLCSPPFARALFHDRGCVHCHGVGAVGTKKAPALTALRKDKKWTPERITEQILKGGRKMPSFADSVTDAEAADLVAYLRAKHKPAPSPATGN